MSRVWGKSEAPAKCRCDLPSAEQAWRQGLKDGATWQCGMPGCIRTYRLSVDATAAGVRGGIYTRVSWS